MKLGLLTAPFPELPLTDVADWAAANGYPTLEVACWPRSGGDARRYAGTSHIDVATLDAAQASELNDDLRSRGVEICALGYYPNPLHPDLEHRAMTHDHLRAVMRAAALLGVPVVNTFIGNDKDKSPSENFAEFRRVWPDLVSYASDQGVKIAIENCPMIFSYDEWPGGNNIASSPYIWRRILEQWGGTIGLNFDPSHLVLQMIDMGRFIREFGPHILHVQAKDLMIDRDGLYERGILSAGIGWQVPRIPGLGEVDWSVLFSMLYRTGYDGDIIIEHEDRVFEGTDEKVKRGFLVARDVLRPFIK